jgi:hypothetical protein
LRLRPAGETIRATLAAASCVATRPKNSAICFGGSPAATTLAGLSINVGMVMQPREMRKGFEQESTEETEKIEAEIDLMPSLTASVTSVASCSRSGIRLG